jgi:hypothetical protein
MEKPQFINNAGMIVLWPFLQMLFDKSALQYAVTGHDDLTDNGQATLHKILCGIDPTITFTAPAKLSPANKQLVTSMLNAVINQWTVIKNTSIESLREVFLLRNGKLVSGTDKITLTVEHKALDVLVNQLPWSINTIRLPWMQESLQVNWP